MMIPSHLLKIEKTTSAKLNLILSGVCSLAIIIASPFAYIEYKNNLKCIAKERKEQEIWDHNYQQFLYNLEQHQIQQKKEEAARKVQLDNCSNSDFEYYRRAHIMGEELVPIPEQCRKYSVFLLVNTSQFTPEEEYRMNNQRPYFYCK